MFLGLVAPILTWLAANQQLDLAWRMMICACLAIIGFIASLLAWPDTKGQEIVPDLELQPAGQAAPPNCLGRCRRLRDTTGGL